MQIKFDDIWGQPAALGVLSQNVARDKVASAYLFSGPQGTGKTKAAMAFANALLCPSDGDRPCGHCRACTMFAAGSHPDSFSVSPDGVMIKIEQVRDLIAAIGLKSYMGGRKVCLMLEAEAMNRTTANAFLKTLEEPPGDTVLILVSSNPAGLLPTIVSRCRMVRFVPMEPEALAPLLEERLSVDHGDALRLAWLAQGCPGRALGGGVEQVRQVDDAAQSLLAALPRMTPDEVVQFAGEWKNRREDLPALLERLAEALRLAQTRHLTGASGTIDKGRNALEEIPDERLMDCFDLIMESRPALVFNPNVQLFLEALVFNLQSIVTKGYPVGTESY
ncbi:MAG: DNA polymerase III subunit delta' [Nitrospinae bacterium]|nr:DNA polymerase III subunit delta' [Nitrospinota bacterium]